MKKILFIMLIEIFLSSHAFALGSDLQNMRNQLYADSKQIKALLLESQDVVLMSSMWDSCVLTMTQLDAYFYMIGIFNTIEKEDRKEDAVDYMVNWLNIIKRTNQLNIKSLDALIQTLEPRTQVYKKRLKKRFIELNKHIAYELGKLAVLKKSLTLSHVDP